MNGKVTKWFGPEVRPAHVGWYEREWHDDLQETNDYWNGSYWQNGGEDNKKSESKAANNKRWRGLAEKP